MNNTSLSKLEEKKRNYLQVYKLDDESILEFRKTIQKVSQEEADALGKELLDMISKKSFKDNSEKAIELMQRGANLECKTTNKGNFPLLICTIRDYAQTFLALLRAGANVNQTNNYLTTAAFSAARNGRLVMLDILIFMRADINLRCLDGDTPLMSAKRHSHVECFQRLCDAQAYLTNQNLAGYTFLDLPGDVGIFFPPLFESRSSGSPSRVNHNDPLQLIEEAENALQNLEYLGDFEQSMEEQKNEKATVKKLTI